MKKGYISVYDDIRGRYALKRTNQSNSNQGFPYLFLNYGTTNNSRLFNAYHNTGTASSENVPYYPILSGKTIEFVIRFMPDESNSSFAILLNQTDRVYYPSYNVEGVDFLRKGNEKKVYIKCGGGNSNYRNVANFAYQYNKLYRFSTSYYSDDSLSNYTYKVKIYEDENLILNLGSSDGLYSVKNTDVRALTFFNTHWNYLRGNKNVTDMLYEVCGYYNLD